MSYTVADLFADLASGELSQTSLANAGNGTLTPAGELKVVRFANQALKLLATRFALKKGYFDLTLQDGVQNYDLADEVDDLLKVLKVTRPGIEEDDEPEIVEIPINDESASETIRMTGYDKIFIKEPVAGQVLTFKYQTLLPKITLPVDPNQAIYIHPLLEDALAAKVAARVFSSMAGEEHKGIAGGLGAEFERICELARDEDIMQETVTASTSDKLARQGFR